MNSTLSWKNFSLCLIRFVLQGQLACYSRYLLTTYFCIPVAYDEKNIFFSFFLLLVLGGLVGLHRAVHLLPLQH